MIDFENVTLDYPSFCDISTPQQLFPSSSWIQSNAVVTLAYTPGYFGLAHVSWPQDTTPIR